MQSSGYIGMIQEYINTYMEIAGEMPVMILLGDGFSGFGMQKGGDIGLIETLARLGLPLFLLSIISIVLLVSANLKTINYRDEFDRNMIKLCVSIILLAAINELHYTIWTSKSVLPILFIVFAILGNIQDKKLFSPKYDKELAFNSSVDERALEIKT